MVYLVGLHPGATWRRADIQCHTPRDLAWRGGPALPGGDDAAEAARAAWASDFVAAALAKGLSLIAVTDHHDTALMPYVIQAARADQQRLLVLPGVEITCDDNVQCLAIFDPSTGQNDWDRLISRLDKVRPAPSSDPKTANVEHCGLNLERLFKIVSDDEILRKIVLLIPHFGRNKDHKSLNSIGHAPRAKELPFDGVYIECHHHELDSVTLDKIQGRIEEWGTRRRAILATGDNRSSCWSRLGAHECWIKIGENTVEAIRQAFLADEARITFRAPETPSERIVELQVKSRLTGTDTIHIAFNEGFTALIGGRGSGKSSILEYLRFGLGRAETDVAPEDAPGRRRRDREAKLIEETLAGGEVTVVLEREGVRETWTRSGDNPEEIIVNLPDGGEERIAVAAAQQRFRARAFHQKELSTTMVNPEAAADNITGIAAAEVIEERRRIDQEIGNAKRTVTTALQEAAAHWQAELELAQARSVVDDLKRRMSALSQRLEQGGVQQADLDILAEAPRYDRAQSYLQEVRRQIVDDLKQIQALQRAAMTLDSSRYADGLDFPIIAALHAKVVEARAQIVNSLLPALAALNDLESARANTAGEFGTQHARFSECYSQAKERQAAHRTLIQDNERLGLHLKEAKETEDKAALAEAASRPAETRFAASRQELAGLLQQRYDLLKRASEKVVEKSNGSLKARVKRDSKPAEYVNALCGLLEGSRMRESEQQCEEWVGRILQEGSPGWTSVCDALLDIYKAKILAGSPTEPGTEASAAVKQLFFDGEVKLTPTQVSKIYANLSDQSLGMVLAATPKDSIKLTYVSGGQDIRFEEASPGQQASALLRLLLRQEAGTLIVDQPEDDLDNRVMMEIVQLIKTSKTTRQIIFATHNPNLVVNGDADKVITMVATIPEDRVGLSAPRIRVDIDGAIETPKIRDAITQIMEGGANAFDLRARKYGFDALLARG